MGKILQVLMKRDGMSKEEAQELINEAREALKDYLNAEDFDSAEYICEEFFGLEPDYVMELI